MLTIKWIDPDNIEHISEARDIRANKQASDGGTNMFPRCVSWIDGDNQPCTIKYPATVYVISESGAKIAKYVILGEGECQTHVDGDPVAA